MANHDRYGPNAIHMTAKKEATSAPHSCLAPNSNHPAGKPDSISTTVLGFQFLGTSIVISSGTVNLVSHVNDSIIIEMFIDEERLPGRSRIPRNPFELFVASSIN
jgi:hypothetical protein